MKKKILIKGSKVHDVGYKLFLMDLADSIGIQNFDADNLKEDNKEILRVLVEASEEEVKNFFNSVKVNFPHNAKVDSVNLEDLEDYNKYIRSTESFRSAFSASQLSKIAQAGVMMLKEIKVVGEKVDAVGEKVDNGFEKMHQNFNHLDVKYDKMSEKMDSIDNTLKELTKAILKLVEKKIIKTNLL